MADQNNNDSPKSVLAQNLDRKVQNDESSAPQIHVVHNPSDDIAKTENKTNENPSPAKSEPFKVNVTSFDAPVNFHAVDKKEPSVEPKESQKADQPDGASDDKQSDKPLEQEIDKKNTQDAKEEDVKEEITPEPSITKPSSIEATATLPDDAQDVKKFADEDEVTDSDNDNYDKIFGKPKTVYPPITKHSSSRGTIAIITSAAIIVLVLGLFGGYMGYGNLPNPLEKLSISADQQLEYDLNQDTTSTESAPQVNQDEPPAETSNEPTQTKQTYTNSKYGYSFSYPSNWFAKNIDDPQAKSIQLTSYDPQKSVSSIGGKMEIVVTDLKGQTLKQYVDGVKLLNSDQDAALKNVTVDSLEAFQIESVNEGKNISTYIPLEKQVLIVSIYMADKNTTDLTSVYNSLIESISLN